MGTEMYADPGMIPGGTLPDHGITGGGSGVLSIGRGAVAFALPQEIGAVSMDETGNTSQW